MVISIFDPSLNNKPGFSRVINGVLSVLGMTAIALGAILPHTATQSTFEAADSPITVRLEPEDISYGPLLDTIASEAFQQQQAQWAKDQAFAELAAAKGQATTIVEGAAVSATALVGEAEKLAAITALDQNYAVASVQLHRPAGYEYRLQSETAIETKKTKTGCDVLLTQKSDTSNQALMTNLAPGSCLPDGTYPAGTVFGKQGEFAVGKRIY